VVNERPSATAIPEPRLDAPSEAYVRGQDFVRRCIAGDAGTREEFLAGYEPLIRFAIRTVLRQKEVLLRDDELEDLLQNVLLSFFDRDCRRLKMYDGRNQASFATFVRVCATRQTLDFLRARRRRQPTSIEVDSDDDGRSALALTPDPASGPEDRAAVAEALALLRQAVAALPAREQILVRLHFVDGLPVPEVARLLGITENATHVLKSRVKAKLRERVDLGDDGNG